MLNDSPEEVDGQEVCCCSCPACPDGALLLCAFQLEPCQRHVVVQAYGAARSSLAACAMIIGLESESSVVAAEEARWHQPLKRPSRRSSMSGLDCFLSTDEMPDSRKLGSVDDADCLLSH